MAALKVKYSRNILKLAIGVEAVEQTDTAWTANKTTPRRFPSPLLISSTGLKQTLSLRFQFLAGNVRQFNSAPADQICSS